jgi:threonylcarbamoyladenosine tRNA methylthiotransferase MtaB
VGKFFVQNFGCRATQADGAAIEALLAAKGLEAAEVRASADLVVLNTCTVTSTADDEVRQTIRRVHRENPAARILVTGCYAQRAPEELASLAGVEWVVGNSHKAQIAELVTVAPYHGNIHVGDIFAQHDFLAAPVEDAGGDRTRPNLKIQDGCNNRCSFCIIPFVRGRSRSAPAGRVVEQVRGLAARYREIVLSGINLGRWGREPGSTMRLADLIRLLLAETGVERLRLSSVEPMDFSDDLLGLMAESSRMAKHVHAPLQTGSDRILRRMHRKYRPPHYADRIVKARALMRWWDFRAKPRRISKRAGGSLRTCRSPIYTCSLIRSGRGRRRRKIRMWCPWRCARSATARCASWRRRRIARFARAWWGRRFPL